MLPPLLIYGDFRPPNVKIISMLPFFSMSFCINVTL